jgi:hypothetical protein
LIRASILFTKRISSKKMDYRRKQQIQMRN